MTIPFKLAMSQIKWYKTEELLPQDKQEVLIYVYEINHIATYNSCRKGFELRNEELKFIAIENSMIYWMELPNRETIFV
ncbi:MAG: hypothetical protein V4608_04770 [Bacteroidota bacterium]